MASASKHSAFPYTADLRVLVDFAGSFYLFFACFLFGFFTMTSANTPAPHRSAPSINSGHLFIISAPSGAGKTTLVRQLLERDRGLTLSISTTTRAPRPGEIDGRDYHFVNESAFMAQREQNGFLEWAHVHGNYYGTSLPWMEAQWQNGRDVILEIDWQGAAQVKKALPQAVGIFILPPSFAVLQKRLTGRGTDSADVIARRLAAAQAEMRHVDEFDYVIINEHLTTALEALHNVVCAQRLSLASQRVMHRDLFSQLMSPAEAAAS